MSSASSYHFVVAYDISSAKQRERVAILLSDYGLRVQKSLFECNLVLSEKKSLFAKLESMWINGDSLRVYYLCVSCLRKRTVLGKKHPCEDNEHLIFI